MFRLLHLSDPHLAPLPRPPWHSLFSKRVFGAINWARNRGAALAAPTLAALVDDGLHQKPDHIAVTGDLVNIALPAEYANASRWLHTLGAPADVSVVPGNHDAYVPGGRSQAMAAWAEFLRSDDGGVRFPLVRERGPVVLVGLSTAIATPPGFATGHVGTRQIDAAAALLDRHDDKPKVMLIHHPPDIALASGRRRLLDHAPVRNLIAERGVDLVLHGHTHRASLTFLETVKGRCAVLGVPSASSDGTKHPAASYALVTFLPGEGIMRITRRGLAPEVGSVRQLDTVELPVCI